MYFSYIGLIRFDCKNRCLKDFILGTMKLGSKKTGKLLHIEIPNLIVILLSPPQDTALHLAAKNGHAALVTYLLSHESQNVTYNAYNQNALDVAIEAGKEPVVLCIAEHTR